MAVRRGLPRPQGRLPRARHPGHRRQRQPLQPDRRDRDPADPGGRRPRRDRGRHPAHAVRPGAPPASGSSCSARPARSSPARSGRTSCTATSAGCRRGSTWRPSGRWPSCSHEAVGLRHQRPRPLRRRPRAGAGRGRAAPRRRRHACDLPGDAFLDLFAESAGRALVTVAPGDADALTALAARHGVPLTALGETGGDAVVVGRAVPAAAGRGPRGLDRHPARRAGLTRCGAGPRWRCPRSACVGAALGCLWRGRTRERDTRGTAPVRLRRRPEPVRRAPPAGGHAARRGRGHPRRLLARGVRPHARHPAGRRPGRGGLGGVEPGVPPGRRRPRGRRGRAGHPGRRGGRHRPAAGPRTRPRHGAHPRALRGRAPRGLGGLARALRAVAGRRRRHRRGLAGRRARPALRARRGARRRGGRGVPRPPADRGGRGRRPGAAGPARRAAGLRARPRTTRSCRSTSPRGTSRGPPPPGRAPRLVAVDGDHFTVVDTGSAAWATTLGVLADLA